MDVSIRRVRPYLSLSERFDVFLQERAGLVLALTFFGLYFYIGLITLTLLQAIIMSICTSALIFFCLNTMTILGDVHPVGKKHCETFGEVMKVYALILALVMLLSASMFLGFGIMEGLSSLYVWAMV